MRRHWLSQRPRTLIAAIGAVLRADHSSPGILKMLKLSTTRPFPACPAVLPAALLAVSLATHSACQLTQNTLKGSHGCCWLLTYE